MIGLSRSSIYDVDCSRERSDRVEPQTWCVAPGREGHLHIMSTHTCIYDFFGFTDINLSHKV